MKKIGILTFHTANNFGAVLQAMSLCNRLSELSGSECELIDYNPDFIQKDYSPNPFVSKHPKAVIKGLLRCPDKFKRNKKFENFRKAQLLMSNRVQNENSFKQICNQYKKIVVGSDQVWNYNLTKFDFHYFLDGVDDSVQKYSYAASTGDAEFTVKNAEYMLKLLENFSKISVRETASKSILESALDEKQIFVNLDPVFLTSGEEWRKIATVPSKKKYILFFKMGYSTKADPALQFAKKLSKAMGYELIMLWDQEIWFQYRDVKHAGVAGPDEFLGWIANAECVVTNSFHATAFSILFNTPFYVETEIDRKERVLNILDLFNLQFCGLVKGQNSSNELKIPCISWENVNCTLEIEKKKSLEYIKSIIQQ